MHPKTSYYALIGILILTFGVLVSFITFIATSATWSWAYLIPILLLLALIGLISLALYKTRDRAFTPIPEVVV